MTNSRDKEMDLSNRPIPHSEYARLVEIVVLHLRRRIRYGETVSLQEVHDVMDAIHNIPSMLLGVGGWHVPENIDADLKRYDAKWPPEDGVSRVRLLKTLIEIRRGEYDAPTPLPECFADDESDEDETQS